MNRGSSIKGGFWATTLVVFVGCSSGSALAAEHLNPDADEILRAMSKFLAGTKAFSVSADVSNEIITQEGQKLQLNSYATVIVERPSRIHVVRQGKFADAALIYDGNKLTMFGKTLNIYAQMDVAGTIDNAIAAVESRTGLDFPGADLLFSDPYAVLASGISSSGYYGKAYVQGVECHHLAFRKDNVDWQVWVMTGDRPLPVKYVITTKWMTGAPQYSMQFSHWNTRPAITPGEFTFVPPKGARKVDTLPVDEAGEVTATEEGK
ncbi:DUF2092 domain-containing protein [Peristeroidobacter soli]|jgi:hypothetical protein|uniref:DUF2092 domain-containing protein n=1 Tax=Peristeroidobacter soli TaxID=2497877 RepID=UPI00101B8939|nr:DUF2092 domain-containing protein [Peristeroidobacter soli]